MTTIGHYEILGVIGDGGMGTVYKARDPRFDRLVAIKVLHPHFQREPGIVDRFKTEAVIQARLQHPNIVGVHDFIGGDRALAIVMEFVEGQPLDRVIKQSSQGILVPWAVAVAAQALLALGFAHGKGLVHRDIKPSNILVQDFGGEPLAKVTDFGVAKVLGNEKLRTATGAKMGTLAYMSPEQIRNPKSVDARTDIYAMGVTLFEMLTGRVPYDGDTEYEVMSKIMQAPVPALSEVAARVPALVVAAVGRAMAKDPAGRLAGCEEMRAMLLGAMAAAAPSVFHVLLPSAGLDGPHYRPAPPPLPVPVVNAAGMLFVPIPAGQFMMGASPGDAAARDEERPPRVVRLSRSFEIGQHPVTLAQWAAVMRTRAVRDGEGHWPVSHVSWHDAHEFVRRLSEGGEGYHYRLPTEAEWEYAARAGVQAAVHGPLGQVAWYRDNSRGRTQPTGSLLPNGWQLFDTLGNVWEWCADWYDRKSYFKGENEDPQGPPSGKARVARGGSYRSRTWDVRVSSRGYFKPSDRLDELGFRCVRVPGNRG